MLKFLVVFLTLFYGSLLFAQDTLVGWTIPVGTIYPLADMGNVLNKGGMYLEAAKIDELPFDTIRFYYSGFSTNAGSSNGWQNGKNLKCWKFSCDATGYDSMKVYFRISSDKNHPGPRDFLLQYRLGCCDPEWFGIPAPPIQVDTGWISGFVNGIDIPAKAKDMPGLQIRVVCNSDTATDGQLIGPNGVSLIDDIIITGKKFNAINDQNKNSKLKIYPNPNNGNFRIQSDHRILKCILTDIFGNIIYRSDPKTDNFRIDLTLPAGLYFLRMNSGKEMITKKIMVK